MDDATVGSALTGCFRFMGELEFQMQMENAKGPDDAKPLQSLNEVYEVRSLAIRAEELMH